MACATLILSLLWVEQNQLNNNNNTCSCSFAAMNRFHSNNCIGYNLMYLSIHIICETWK